MWARSETRAAFRGFTLLELLVVIAIMTALTAAFPLALNRFLPARRLDASARELVADIRMAQARSVATNVPVSLVPAGSGYTVTVDSPDGAQSVATRAWRASTSLALRSSDGSRTLAALRVFPDGSSSGALFELRDGERVRKVVVSELTSRTRIETAPTGAGARPRKEGA
jgi:type II secretion system protein H